MHCTIFGACRPDEKNMEVSHIGKLETAVVILCYNGRKLLEELLPIALANTAVDDRTRIILADNASTDDTVEWANLHYPEVPLLRFHSNFGFTGGYNKALDLIEAEYYVLLSNDVEVAARWLPPLIDQMKKDQTVGACQPKVLSYHRREHFEYAGAAGGFLDHWGMPFCRGRVFFDIEKDTGQYNDVREIFWAGGCCFAIRGAAWHRAKGLEPDFFAHMEEVDLCWRLQGMGYKILVCPGSEVFHMGGQTLSYTNPTKLYLNCRNNLAMLTKNWPASRLLWKLPLRLLMDWLSAFYFLISRGFPSFKAVLKGQFHFLLHLGHWLKKRKEVQRVGTNQLKGYYPGSIAFAHFVKGVNVFSNLYD